MKLFYSDRYEIPLSVGHKFPLRKYRLLRERLTETGRFEFAPAPLADAHTIERIHTPEYVRSFLDGTLPAAVMRRIGFPWSEALVLRTLASVGSTLAAAHEALACGWGGRLAGGTHHAFRDEGAGFCVCNDIAVAIAALRAERHIECVRERDPISTCATAELSVTSPIYSHHQVAYSGDADLRSGMMKINIPR